ncbi:hypothetical protein GOP47_0014496 [Adiantum capillus-veneris]|uniref:Histone-lysine N-methyltransferase n=1 Tax=Adiantum capillus-veneris TaxID=13818 RepID=A0A9D4ULK8_ADICA|nr:hypothetical protein GOP47_0014496 [Adiantum capillus-veneris]
MARRSSRSSKRVLAADPGIGFSLQLTCKEKTQTDNGDIACQLCKLGDRENQLLLCDGCDRGFHSTCLRPIVFRIPSGSWLCPLCSSSHRGSITDFPLVQTKIIDFFRIQRPFDLAEGARKRRKTNSGIFLKKKSRRLLAFTPSKDPSQRLKQMASLATAMTNSGVEYSDVLTYMPGLAPRSANDASLEKGGMQVMSKEDKASYDQCKEMSRGGACPPLMVTFDSHEGFVVEADGLIKDLTIVAEYTGDVDYMSKRENDDGDSIMGLLFTESSSNDLVICPDKRGNIARFVSGINNHTREGRKKQNLKSVRFNINGKAHALLIAIRDIHKGERLYYDYNGYQHDYPTEHFV